MSSALPAGGTRDGILIGRGSERGGGCAVPEESDRLSIEQCLVIHSTGEQELDKLWGLAQDDELTDLEVSIFGGGGSAFESFACFEILKGLATRGVMTRAIVYFAHSAGVCWVLGCAERVGFETTTFMLHAPDYDIRDEKRVSAQELKDLDAQAQVADGLRDLIVSSSTRITKEQIAKETCRREWWLNADRALELGLLTEIRGRSRYCKE